MSPFRGLDVDALKMLYQDENPFLMESGKPSAASAAIESTDGSQWGTLLIIFICFRPCCRPKASRFPSGRVLLVVTADERR
jgi:hypothetical protein